MEALIERFLKYVSYDTQSDPNSKTTPSSEKQWDLARVLTEELKNIGLSEVYMDDKAYITATLPANIPEPVPVIGFISHFDTSPDFSGTKINPRIIENYDGKDILLNAAQNIVLSPGYFEELKSYIGQTLIVTDGTTLLGADDKAGIAEIITALDYLIQNPQIKHGTIRVGFTPDEEIGRGAHHFDVQKFGANWAYTIDGSTIGELEYENFNAARARITISGKSVHPGYAKNKMINAITLLQKFMSGLPTDEIPQKTDGREGFFHIHQIGGSIEHAWLEMIIRDHDKTKFEARKKLIRDNCKTLEREFKTQIELELKDQYYNMKEKILPVYHVVEIAREAMESQGIRPILKPIRGGTDGSQLSYMGLPCPNIFAGGHNFHGKYEYIPVQSMEKAVAVIVKICEITATKTLEQWMKTRN